MKSNFGNLGAIIMYATKVVSALCFCMDLRPAKQYPTLACRLIVPLK